MFAGIKKAYKISDVSHIIVPLLDELSVKNMLEMIKPGDAARDYFPETYWKKAKPDRTYVFNVINTVYPDYLNQLISHAQRQRIGIVANEMATNTILATDEWLENLKKVPFYSRVSHLFQLITHIIQKPGRTLHLLKEKSKPAPAERKRRKFDLQGDLTAFKKAIVEASDQEQEQEQLANINSSSLQPQNYKPDKEMKHDGKTIF